MSRETLPSHLDGFETLISDERPTKCIWRLWRHSYRECRLPGIDSTYLGEKILSSRNPHERRDLLQQYAENRCCARWHRNLVLNPHFLKELCDRWMRDCEKIDLERDQQKSRKFKDEGRTGKGTQERTHRMWEEQDKTYRREPGNNNGHKKEDGTGPRQDSGQTRNTRQERPKDEKPTGRSTKPETKASTASASAPCGRRPATRAWTEAGETIEQVPSTAPTPHFMPYKTDPHPEALSLKLQGDLTPQAKKSGSVYLFTRTSDPAHVKIGYTTKTAAERLGEWYRTCKYVPQLRHIVDVPNALRVEKLVHLELVQHRRRETKCRHNPDCPTKHEEWFEIDVGSASKAMDRWAKWMTEAKPYDEAGRLRNEWLKMILRLTREGRVINSDVLLKAMPDVDREAEHMVNTSITSVPKPEANSSIEPEQRDARAPAAESTSSSLSSQPCAAAAHTGSVSSALIRRNPWEVTLYVSPSAVRSNLQSQRSDNRFEWIREKLDALEKLVVAHLARDNETLRESGLVIVCG